ncbi:MAG: hypothetical protein PHC43_00230 [Candidatus Marinimicrobia bacterium]|jgi:hypothetical protein|nr:hypothetical protein [Candidatus Neomarinimicrobiota bacterium]
MADIQGFEAAVKGFGCYLGTWITAGGRIKTSYRNLWIPITVDANGVLQVYDPPPGAPQPEEENASK